MGLAVLKIEDLPHYNYDDYALWEGKWEIINGVPYAMTPASSVKHQYISQRIAAHLGNLLKNCKRVLKYRLYQAAGVKYYCIIDPETYSTEIFQLIQNKYTGAGDLQDKKMIFDLGPCTIAFDFDEVFNLEK